MPLSSFILSAFYYEVVLVLVWSGFDFSFIIKVAWERGKMAEEWIEAKLASSQDQSGITAKLWRNHQEQTTEQ